ncbi:hypothetical protein [Halobellus rarus]|uniref:DUF1102 domain-containing protein n=1 Tax=Halobellus rarus TaxID=1126237 RepID=A0ABD6CNN2_9EURY|nr:hypothetical protein [Halobellus rarus]
MSALRTLSLVLAFTAAVGLVFGTAGFTAVNADRGLAVNVTDDDSAYLGYEPLADEVRDDESTAVVEYHNQFGQDLDTFGVNVSIVNAESGATIESVDAPDRLGGGAADTVDVTLDCPTEEDVTLLFEADGGGGGVSVSLDRVHAVTCLPGDTSVTGVRFDGAGNAEIETQGGDGRIPARVWLAEKPPEKEVTELSVVTLDGDEKLETGVPVRPQVNRTPDDWTIVAIESPDADVAYVHPGWNAGVYDTPKSGSGVAYGDLPLDEHSLLNASVTNGSVGRSE